MTPSEIDIEIQTYIISIMTEAPYSEIFGYTFEGVDMDSEPDTTSSTWLLFTISVVKTEDVEISRNGIGIRYGNLHVSINSSKSLDNGKRLGLEYADEIEADFVDYSTNNINFQKPNTIYIKKDKDWHKHMVTIPFYTTIGE